MRDSSDQRTLALASTRIVPPVLAARRLIFRLRTERFLAKEPVDAVDAGRFSVRPKQDEKPPEGAPR
uniref:Uncharacterized protein n=1 Tax=Rhizobium leguminosarum TaxID=384 RepID=A0A154IKZ0_RHILE|nr:hypothetical protein A4A59_13590 [Rhizobium leguminosarum]